MKNTLKYPLLLVVFITLFNGCSIFESSDPPKPTDKYLVSFERHKTYLPAYIRGIINVLAGQYPELKTFSENVKYTVDVYKIKYNTKYEGKDIVASGLVAVPKSDGAFPLISYQNGTNTLNSNAPSVNPDYEMYLLLEFMASTGFIVAVPDYLGFGASSSMYHPYYDKKSTVESVTDMLWAVNELVKNYMTFTNKKDLYLMGYSQGGWATMQLQKYLEENYASEFNLKASACGAGGYDLRFINNHILSQAEYPMPYFIGYIFNSYIKSGKITIPATDVFKSPYSERILTLYDGTKSGDEINAQLTTKTTDLFTAEYLTGANTNPKFLSVMTSLSNNSISVWKTNVPTMILHGTEDTYVPAQGSLNIYNEFLTKGVPASNLTLVPIPGAGHNSAIIPTGVASINWFIELNKKN